MSFEEVQLMKDRYSTRGQFHHCLPLRRIERSLLITSIPSRLATPIDVVLTTKVSETGLQERQKVPRR